MDDLVERLEAGVREVGLHDDNSTELFDIEEANDLMSDAKEKIEAQAAEIADLRRSVKILLSEKHKEVAEAKLWFERGQDQAAEIARLREALSAVWKEASTMRGASKLVGPYPNEIGKHRIWARSMYHAGKRIMELLKPARQPAQH